MWKYKDLAGVVNWRQVRMSRRHRLSWPFIPEWSWSPQKPLSLSLSLWSDYFSIKKCVVCCLHLPENNFTRPCLIFEPLQNKPASQSKTLPTHPPTHGRGWSEELLAYRQLVMQFLPLRYVSQITFLNDLEICLPKKIFSPKLINFELCKLVSECDWAIVDTVSYISWKLEAV